MNINFRIRNHIAACVTVNGDSAKVEIPCVECGEVHEFSVPFESLLAFHNGRTYIQDAFPQLSCGEREMFLSGLCPKCYDNLFQDDEDE